MKKIIKLKNKYGMIVCVLFCVIYFCLGCGQEDETVFLEQKEELSEETEKTNETEVEKELISTLCCARRKNSMRSSARLQAG